MPLSLSSVSKPALVAAIAGTAVAVTGSGVYALLSAKANNTTAQSAKSGTLSLTLNGGAATFAADLANLVPAQTETRYVTLTNGGSLAGKDLKLAVTDATPTLLSTDATKGLQVSVASCSVAWVAGACADTGGGVAQLTSSLKALTTAPVAFTTGTMAAAETKHLKVTVTLPDQTEETVNGVLPASTIQGLTAALTWTFTETQV